MQQGELFTGMHTAAHSDETPLERLWRRGRRSLSDAELLSVFLRAGCSQAQSLEMARKVLAGAGLAGLLYWEASKLLDKTGLGVAKVGTLLALAELVRRISYARMPQRQLMKDRDRVAGYLCLRYHQVHQEIMGALYLDTRSRLIEERVLYRGTIDRAAVEPRAVLLPALLCGAVGFILFHVHPSGDPSPSTDDLHFTRQLKRAASITGMELHDHLILGSGRRYVSLEARGF